jgi:hypothetical protein
VSQSQAEKIRNDPPSPSPSVKNQHSKRRHKKRDKDPSLSPSNRLLRAFSDLSLSPPSHTGNTEPSAADPNASTSLPPLAHPWQSPPLAHPWQSTTQSIHQPLKRNLTSNGYYKLPRNAVKTWCRDERYTNTFISKDHSKYIPKYTTNQIN